MSVVAGPERYGPGAAFSGALGRMDTIYALSSGALPAGIAVIRVSGPRASQVLEAMTESLPRPGSLRLRDIRDPETGLLLDRGMVVWNAAPKSFTGEDVCEFQVHGSRAVVSAVSDSLSKQKVRLAEPGEFTRRAFQAGKLDLTEVEALADLIAAETEMQRRQAVLNTEGHLRGRSQEWRSELIRLRSDVEARLDFAEEGDVGTALPSDHAARVQSLKESLRVALVESENSERVREGYKVAITGRPNAGKSSLLNALVKRDVAIVTCDAGTTRDVLEVRLDLEGHAVSLYDTAGLRDAHSVAEQEGIRRAIAISREADLVLQLIDCAEQDEKAVQQHDFATVKVMSKIDLLPTRSRSGLAVSAKTGEGLAQLLMFIAKEAAQNVSPVAGVLFRHRHKAEVGIALASLEQIRSGIPEEIAAHLLQHASGAIGRLTGHIDVEEVLDVLFREFCIGK